MTHSLCCFSVMVEKKVKRYISAYKSDIIKIILINFFFNNVQQTTLTIAQVITTQVSNTVSSLLSITFNTYTNITKSIS